MLRRFAVHIRPALGARDPAWRTTPEARECLAAIDDLLWPASPA